jgi:hypothetical protein
MQSAANPGIRHCPEHSAGRSALRPERRPKFPPARQGTAAFIARESTTTAGYGGAECGARVVCIREPAGRGRRGHGSAVEHSGFESFRSQQEHPGQKGARTANSITCSFSDGPPHSVGAAGSRAKGDGRPVGAHHPLRASALYLDESSGSGASSRDDRSGGPAAGAEWAPRRQGRPASWCTGRRG